MYGYLRSYDLAIVSVGAAVKIGLLREQNTVTSSDVPVYATINNAPNTNISIITENITNNTSSSITNTTTNAADGVNYMCIFFLVSNKITCVVCNDKIIHFLSPNFSLVMETKEELKSTSSPEIILTPWEFKGTKGVATDYTKIMTTFGSSPIGSEILARIEKLTDKKPHRFLRRGIFFSHRDLGTILDLYESKTPFYLYTGRGPSSASLHLGHLVQFMFTKYLQEAFDVPLVIQLTDDEKFFWNKKSMTLEESHALAYENAKDIIACGFDPTKTFIFTNLDYMGQLYPNVCKIQKALTFNQVRNTFGFKLDDPTLHAGKFAFPAIQAAPSFCNSFPHLFGTKTNIPCLIPCAIDQDPYFRLTRDIAPSLGYRRPSLIHSKFFPSLKGIHEKMSASDTNSCITCQDTAKQITKKIKGSFSGSSGTPEEHRVRGANLEVDVPFHYLTFFLEDDELLEEIRLEYSTGKILASKVKEILTEVLVKLVAEFQGRRSLVSDEVLKSFMKTT